MFKNILVATVVLGSFAFSATPSFALKGIEALQQCVDRSVEGCKLLPDLNGGIVVAGPKGGFIHCRTLEAECEVVHHKAVTTTSDDGFEVPQSLIEGSDGGSSGHSFSSGTGGGGRGPVTLHHIQ